MIRSKINTLSKLINTLDNNFIVNADLFYMKNIFENYNGIDWKKYKNNDDKIINNNDNNTNTYNKNVIFRNNNYELLLINWERFSESPIHDHSENGCLYKILDGELTEEIYNKNIKLLNINKLKKNESSYITNNIGYHKIINNNNINTYSLHLYSPPLYTIKVFK